MIEIKNVSKNFDKKKIFEDFSLNIKRGERVAIIGTSGKGKTTLLNLITSLESVDNGEILFSDNLKYGMVFQENRLCENFTVWENLYMINHNLSRERVIATLETIELRDEIDNKIKNLSGGMKRRIAILRAILYECDVLIMDEPIKGLDNQTKSKVIEFVNLNIKDRAFILVTHNIKEVDDFEIDRVVKL